MTIIINCYRDTEKNPCKADLNASVSQANRLKLSATHQCAGNKFSSQVSDAASSSLSVTLSTRVKYQ